MVLPVPRRTDRRCHVRSSPRPCAPGSSLKGIHCSPRRPCRVTAAGPLIGVLNFACRRATHWKLDRQVLEIPTPTLQALLDVPDFRSDGPLAPGDLSLRLVHQSLPSLQPTASVAVVPTLVGRRALPKSPQLQLSFGAGIGADRHSKLLNRQDSKGSECDAQQRPARRCVFPAPSTMGYQHRCSHRHCRRNPNEGCRCVSTLPYLGSAHPTIPPRRQAVFLLEPAREMTAVGESAFEGNFRDASRRVQETPARVLKPHVAPERERQLLGVALEGTLQLNVDRRVD